MSKNNNQAGKGDKPRPVNKKAFDTNFESIVWKKQTKEPKTNKSKTTYVYN